MSLRHLISPCSTNEVAPCCQTLLKQFDESSVDFYGTGFVSYNVHSLIRLVDDFVLFGSLDSINRLAFES